MTQFTLPGFEQQVGTTYEIDLGDGTVVDLVLASATRITSAGATPRDDGRPFSLLFRGPAEHPFGQGIRTLNHPEDKAMDIFLVPIQPDGDGPLYEAIFA